MLTRTVDIGGVVIGGENPIAIQSMTKTDTRDVDATLGQVCALRDAGCEIVRLAVLNMEAAEAFGKIRRAAAGVPLVADIHFDYRLALECICQGADKIRINPGNIGDMSRVKQVADAARERGIPIRIGVNGGSLDKTLMDKYGGVTAEALAESAVTQSETLNMCGFYDIVVSIKASDVFKTVEACKLFDARNTGIPQHIGITEAGSIISGLIKSTVGMYELLNGGIGDTLRVSLTGDPVDEVVAAKTLLHSVKCARTGKGGGASRGYIEVISCPTCGRCRIDLVNIARDIERRIISIKTDKHIKVAVMGCEVNGPGEAKEADIGIAGGAGKALLFKRGEKPVNIPESKITDTLINAIIKMA